jgi:hypothetical protein
MTLGCDMAGVALQTAPAWLARHIKLTWPSRHTKLTWHVLPLSRQHTSRPSLEPQAVKPIPVGTMCAAASPRGTAALHAPPSMAGAQAVLIRTNLQGMLCAFPKTITRPMYNARCLALAQQLTSAARQVAQCGHVRSGAASIA